MPGEMYYLGVFMVGAYQDIMGDLHNLFGRVNEVHVFLDPDEESGWYIEEVIEGSTIGQVLALTQWDKIELMRLVKLAGRRGDQERSAEAERRDEAARRLRARSAGIHLPVFAGRPASLRCCERPAGDALTGARGGFVHGRPNPA